MSASFLYKINKETKVKLDDFLFLFCSFTANILLKITVHN